MDVQELTDIIIFLKTTTELLSDEIYGRSYRAAVYLHDGTFLPCVVFRNPQLVVQLAIKRFNATEKTDPFMKRTSGIGYTNMVRHYALNNKRLNPTAIKSIETSSYAFPAQILEQIDVGNTIGWTGFVCKMKDGKYLGFGTTSTFEFFKIPTMYSVTDIVTVINHSYVLSNGIFKSHQRPMLDYPIDYSTTLVHREMPFVECNLDNL